MTAGVQLANSPVSQPMKLVSISYRADIYIDRNSDVLLELHSFQIRSINLGDVEMLINDHTRFYNNFYNK